MISMSVDTSQGHESVVIIELNGQVQNVVIPDTVIYGVDGTKPAPRKLLEAIVNELSLALAKLKVGDAPIKDDPFKYVSRGVGAVTHVERQLALVPEPETATELDDAGDEA